jgi:hypothetical protein
MTERDIAQIKPLLEANDCEIIDLEEGLVSCPGRHWHTTANADADCKLFHNDDGSFRLYCHHTSCRERIDFLNRCFAAFHNQGKTKRAPARVSVSKRHPQMAQIQKELLDKFAWSYDSIIADSDDAIHEPVEQHYYQILGLFADHDIVWCGRDVQDTGCPKHAYRFRPVREWFAETSCPGQFIAPSTFRPGTYSRRAVNVVERKFLVVESDTLGHDGIGAIFRWLDVRIGLRLRAVVDTAGKSLHGWFEYPKAHILESLEDWLPRLGCDPNMFNPAQPCRLPGALRDGRYQRLIFMR